MEELLTYRKQPLARRPYRNAREIEVTDVVTGKTLAILPASGTLRLALTLQPEGARVLKMQAKAH